MNTFRDALAPRAVQMPRVVREHEILRVIGEISMEPRDEAVIKARGEILKWVQSRCGGQLPQQAWNGETFDYFSGGRNSVGVRIQEPQLDVWAVRADDPDKSVAGRVWTTEVVISRVDNGHPYFNSRLIVSSQEDQLYIEPAVQGFIRKLSENVALIRDGYRFVLDPIKIESQVDYDWFRKILLDPNRSLPIIVLTTGRPVDGHRQLLINTVNLCKTTMGIAVVVILTSEFCWKLSEEFGQQRSVFGGAVRVYLPGFSDESNPYDHRLFLANQLSIGKEKKFVLQWLRNLAARESIKRTRLGQDVYSFSLIRNASLKFLEKNLDQSDADESEKLQAALTRIKALEDTIKSLENENNFYIDEHDKIEKRVEDAEKLTCASAFRIQQLQDQIKNSGSKPDESLALPDTWAKFGDWCDKNLTGRLILSSSARRGVKSPEFEDVQLTARCLLWLANECRESRLGQYNLPLREVQIESGVRNSHCGRDEYETTWGGKRYTVDWHVKNGGNTRDPSRCLRIYYFWDTASQQIIIADMPAHRKTDAS
ncbi:MAG: hypothetical protein HQL76_09465 [Magnetococcales bacterium]|nr:hypothetical protein [Magnetococcales bacterium]